VSAPDVLAVLRRMASQASACRGTGAGEGSARDEDAAAIATVAGLIEQAKAPAVAYGCRGSLGIHFVSDDRDDCVAESQRDGSLVVELIERPRALARVGGAS
jgi:hypothetical protein